MGTRTGALAVYPRMRSVNSLVRERWTSGKVPLIGATTGCEQSPIVRATEEEGTKKGCKVQIKRRAIVSINK